MADDALLVDFLASLEDYIPTIPDELVDHYLAAGGFQCPDARLTRLVAVATQKFVSEIASDALQYSKVRQAGGKGSSKAGAASASAAKDKQRLVLTSDDLAAALREFGVNVRRQEYYADSAVAGTAAAAAAATATPQPQQPSKDEQQQQ